jgi:hypothetical protein
LQLLDRFESDDDDILGDLFSEDDPDAELVEVNAALSWIV